MAKFDTDKAYGTQKATSERINNDFGNNTTIKLEKIDLTNVESVDVTELYSAPKEWNYFDKLSDDKMFELMDSISDNGLISPVILWKIDRKEIFKNSSELDMYGFFGEDYLILSGHNRVQAYLNLHDSTKKDKYMNIPAFVFEKITEFQAKNIIIDSNYTQRDLSIKEKAKSIIDKYHVYENEKIRKGKVAEFIADDLNITPRMVFNYKKLSKLIPQIKDMVYSDELPLMPALKLTSVSTQCQEWLYDEKREWITPKLLNKIKPDSSKKDIQRLIESQEKKSSLSTVKVSVEVPVELEVRFKKMCRDWIYDNSKRDK
ncbi:MAG: ParB/RepB/Spo0J family partition protein [Peptostreptococcaceae bacterium]